MHELIIRGLWCICVAVIVAAGYGDAGKVEDFVNPMKQDIFLVTPQSFESVIGRFRDANGVSVLLHFNSNNPREKKFIKDVYNEAAKETKGMLRLAAIDCATSASFCKANMNPELVYPRVIVYPPHPIPPFLVEKLEKASIIQAAVRFIPNAHVKILNDKNIDAFMTQNVAIPKILLFSTKTAPPIIFKALSNAFSDRLFFGLVPASETTIMKRYKVTSPPTVLAFRPGSKKPEEFTGKISYTALHDWLNIRAETFVKGGGFASQDTKEDAPKPWLAQKVPEMSGPSHQDICFRGSSLCAILLTNGKITNDQTAALEELAEQYSDTAERGARFRWMWLDLSIETNFRPLFNIDMNTVKFPSFVVVNPHKRLRFMALPAQQQATKESITALLERIIAGDGRFVVIKGQKIPPFMPREPAGQSSSRSKDEL